MAARKANTETTEETTTEVVLTPAQMAEELGTDPKTFRRWLRGLTDNRAGKGGRWVFDQGTADQLRTAWAERSAKGTTPTLTDAEA